ncbi:MAG TPA: methyltransferase domain-containing protein [Methanomassiliicoccales archaeon]|nr:methyltransferase domain-containing protein [Methanomassiliicoccales archaeon]
MELGLKTDICVENVSKELKYHGGKWATAHGSYFSDLIKAAPMLDAAHSTAERCRPEVIADIGGGTGFLLRHLGDRLNGLRPRLVNVDISDEQLQVCRERGLDTLFCSALDLRREMLLGEVERLMLISRSVLHYFGREGQDRFLSSLRSVMEEGEMLVHQPACFASKEEKECMNELYPMMGVDKFYMTPDELRAAHERNGWKVVEILNAPSLDLCSEDLAERYALGNTDLERLCGTLRRYGLDRGTFEVGDKRFRGPFTYRIVIAKAN